MTKYNLIFVFCVSLVLHSCSKDDGFERKCPDHYRYIGVFDYYDGGLLYVPVSFIADEDEILLVDNSINYDRLNYGSFDLTILDEFFDNQGSKFYKRNALILNGDYRDSVALGSFREFIIEGVFRSFFEEGTLEYERQGDTLITIEKSYITEDSGWFTIQPKEFLIDKYPEIENL